MSRAPLVTLGIPVYQAECYVEQALACASEQTYTNLEIWISDNGSTDRTVEICRDWASRDSRIKLHVETQNRGAAWNFNHVARLASGQFFKWLAADDLIAPTYIERCLERLQASDRPLWVHTRFARIFADTTLKIATQTLGSEAGRTMLSGVELGSCRTDARPSSRFRAVVLGPTWLEDNYGLIDRKALLKTRLELPLYGSEKVMLAELALQGHFAEVPELLAYSRTHEQASAALTSVQAQQQFVAPGSPQSSNWRVRLGLLKGFYSAIQRHSLSSMERWRCRAVLLAYPFQFRKWNRVSQQLFSGQAVRSPEPEEDCKFRIAFLAPTLPSCCEHSKKVF